MIDVDNAELKLKPGMTANVTFTYEDKSDVIRVPNIALRFRPPAELMPSASAANGQKGSSAAGEARAGNRRRGGADGERPADSRTVWLLQGTTPVSRAVRIGVSDGTLTEIVEGNLKAGELVLTGVASEQSQGSTAKPAALGGAQQPARRMF